MAATARHTTKPSAAPSPARMAIIRACDWSSPDVVAPLPGTGVADCIGAAAGALVCVGVVVGCRVGVLLAVAVDPSVEVGCVVAEAGTTSVAVVRTFTWVG